ncbi:hypothetical protein BB427_02020 [Pseudoalteromonas sp. BMB]|uniref:glycosyltransferase n=1 Tax=Pseudoalteromonas sp. BMB TaxID=1874619 RepID=UPI00083CAD2D|nr:glycosyltransferase [Pseudoalteromonas sp. BMB]ODB36814.1 hypothetical protein BB427_02020 [Pseudoalteromonas sp. BMB]
MKVGFFHDHIFTKKDGYIHTSGTLDAHVWNRFFDAGATKVIVCGRFSEHVKIGAVAERENVTFVFSENLSNLSSLLLNANSHEVNAAVTSCDVVVARLPSEIGFKAIKEAKKQNKIVVCEVVACPHDALNYHGSLKAKVYSYLSKLRMEKWVARCDGALYVTKNELQSRYPCNGIVANASNVEISDINYDSISVRSGRFNSRKQKGTLKFGLIGTMKNKTKGIDIAINALKGVKGSLHVIGSGYDESYSQLAKQVNVDFRHDGFISDKSEIMKWLDDIDIYLQPSFQEGLPRATIEAMSRGCPVLASNAGGLPELVRSLYIHERGNVNKLSLDIKNIIENYDIDLDTRRSLTIAESYLSEKLKEKRYKFYEQFIRK